MAQQSIGELVYQIKADITGFSASLKETENAVQSLGTKVKSMSDNQATSLFKGIAAWDILKNAAIKTFDVLKSGVDEARQDMVKLNQAKAILEAQGKAWSAVGGEVTAFGQKMLQFGIDDETAMLQVARFSQRLGGDLKKSFEVTKLAADLAASGFGTFAETSNDLERILVGKGLRALVTYGVALKANSTIAEQLAAVQKRVTITSEDLANSTEGQFAKMAVAQEELKSAMGKGVLVAFSDLIKKVGGASGEFITNEDTMKQVAKVAFQLANSVLAIAAAAVAAVQGLAAIPKTFDIGKTKLDIFSAQTARAIAEAAGKWDKVAEMDKKISDLNKNNQGNVQNLDDLAKAASDSFSLMSDSLSKAAGNGFEKLNAQLEEADLKLGKTGLATKELTQAQVDAAAAADTQAKALQDLQKNVLDARDKIVDLASSIKDKLTQSFTDFKTSLGDTITQGTQNLAQLTVKAESDLKDLQKQLAAEQAKAADQQSADTITRLQDEINQKQNILTASSGFETRLNERIVGQQKAIQDLTAKQVAETDPIKKASLETEIAARQTSLDQIKSMGDFQKQVVDERRTAALDEFSQMEEETFKRIDLATTEFITEVTKLREKLEIANGVESDITKFYSEQTTIRQATLDAFSISSIATLQTIGSEAKSAIDAMNALQSAQSRANVATTPAKGKALGGYTMGGEFVHPGEWVMPAWMVNTFSGLVGQLEGVRNGSNISNRTINAPISINARVDSQVDFRAVGREMAWELGRL